MDRPADPTVSYSKSHDRLVAFAHGVAQINSEVVAASSETFMRCMLVLHRRKRFKIALLARRGRWVLMH